jgi:hypothetical protein
VHPHSLAQALLALQFVAFPLLILRICTAGLWRKYPFFTAYLLAEFVQLFIPYIFPFTSRAYGYAFVFSEAPIVALYVLVVLELYSKVLDPLPGIALESRRYIKVSMAVASVVSLSLLFYEGAATNLVARFLVFERAIVFSLVLFVLFIVGFLVYYPIALSRNIIVYSMGYAFLFLVKAAATFGRNLGVVDYPLVNDVLLGITSFCLVFWIVFLSRGGETTRMVIGHSWNRRDEQRVKEQMEAMNAMLDRLRRK